MTDNDDKQPDRLLRRMQAAKYVVDTYNIPCSPKTLAKLACISSDGPPFHAGRFPLYPIAGLDEWAKNKIGPLVRSTSQASALLKPFTSTAGFNPYPSQGDADAREDPTTLHDVANDSHEHFMLVKDTAARRGRKS